ncbi:MAG: lysoplasmalogenase [Caulobacter sp.]|nr:lysoplasmalogenase [Caulobacter sp.]
MAKSKLTTAVLVAAIAGGVSYLAAGAMELSPLVEVAWKGSGVGLLAVYAALRARTGDGWLLAAVMAFGALGDVLLNLAGLIVGAVAFLVGHLFAITLYLRNRRPRLTRSQALLALVLVPATVIIAWLLPTDRSGAPGIAFYAAVLSLMAAAAWISRFPRFVVGLGAVMFVLSDLLIFARLGPLAGAEWPGYGVWTLYFGGQLLICLGVTRSLARPQSAPPKLDPQAPQG